MRRPSVLLAAFVLVLIGLHGSSPRETSAQEARYHPAVRTDTVLEAPSGLRLRVLVEAAALGGTELEVAELTFPGGARTGGGHRHGSAEIFYVLSGTLDHVVEGRTHRLRPGMVGIVRAGDEVAHTVVSEEPVRVLAIWAPGGELDRILPAFRPVAAGAEELAQDADPAPACSGSRFREFDYWAGRWAVHNVDGDRIGTNTITPVSEGCALLEQWQPVRGPAGISLNHYDPVRERWEQLWVGGGGLVLRLAGGVDGEGVMTLTATEPRATEQGSVLDRIRWVPDPDGSVRQIWDISPDGGESWRRSFLGVYRPRGRRRRPR